MTIEKFKACLLLASFGDTLGFNNGMWEFNYGEEYPSPAVTITILWEFISLGGLTHLNLKKSDASDDTILQIATGEALLNKFNNIKDLKNNFIKEYVKALDELKKIKEVLDLKHWNLLKFLKRKKMIKK